MSYLKYPGSDESTFYNVLVEVYSDAAPTTLLDVLDARMAPQILSELKGHGAGSFKISRNDKKIMATPSLINYRNIVKIRLNGLIIGAFIIQTIKSVIVGAGETADEMWEVSGEGLRSASRDAIVYPAAGLATGSSETRYFNFAAPQGSWYNPAQWANAVVTWDYLQAGNWWQTAPAQWPDAPSAKWIWDRNNASYSMPNGFVYFRREFNITTAGPHSFFFAVDDAAEVYVDGELLVTTAEHAWMETSRVDFDLAAGDHIIALKAQQNVTASPGSLIGALFRVGDGTTPTAAVQILVTDTNWKVRAYPTTEPGWTVGDVLITLMNEASARGVRFAQKWAPQFSAAVDSSGNAWDTPIPWSFGVGTTYEDVFASVEELGCDIWIDPMDSKMYVWKKRGFDRTKGVSQDPIILTPGHNLVSAEETGQAQIANTLALRTTEGWTEQATTDPGSLSTYGRVEALLSTNLSSTGATPLVSEIFRQKSLPEKSATFEIVPVIGMIPFVDFFVGDYISAPGQVPGVFESRRVMSISFAEDEKTGAPRYALEFDTIFKDRQQQLEQWLSRVANSGALGGGFTNSNAVPDTVVQLPPGQSLGSVPDAPGGLVVSSLGYYTNSGESESDYGLTWNSVITGVGFGSVTVEGYEVWGRKSTDATSAFITKVFDTFAYLKGYRPGDTWTFKVRAVSTSGGPGPFSPEVSLLAAAPIVSLPAPSTPTLTSSFGVVTVKWDGLIGGSAAPAYVRYVRVERATSSGGPWTAVGTIIRNGMQDVPGSAGSQFWYRLLAVDNYGNASAPSTAAPVTVSGIASTDITGSMPSNNEVYNGSFEDGLSGWMTKQAYATGTNVQIVTSSISGAKSLQLTRGAETAGAEVNLVVAQTPEKFIPISSLGSNGYYISARSNVPSGSQVEGFSLFAYFYLANKTTPASVPVAYGALTRDLTTTPQLFVNKIIPPPDAKYMQVAVVAARPSATINVDDVVVREVMNSQMLGDDVITAEHVSAGAITANALAAESVTATALAAGSILADKIAAGAIQVQHIAPGLGQSLDISSNETVNIIISDLSTVQSNIDSTNSDMIDLKTYYSFGSDAAIIGRTDSAFKLVLKNDKIEIQENGIVVSYWDSGQMVVDRFIGSEVVLGNHKLEKYLTGTIIKAV